MADLRIKDAGVWKSLSSVYVKDAGVWKPSQSVYVKDAGVWTKVFASGMSLIISSDTANYNIYTAAGSPTGAVNITVTINNAIEVYSTSTGIAGMQSGSLPAGSIVTIINNGTIYGMGGKGGAGSNNNANGNPGFTGGPALDTAVELIIDNTNGNIFGGGGGGGGGGNYTNNDGSTTGSGGGGGAGRNVGPAGLRGTGANAAVGTDGAAGTTSAGGAGGVVAPWLHNGGNGGGLGAAGLAGSPGTGIFNPITIYPGGSGGAAGNAVKLNGQSITWTGGNNGTQVKGIIS